MESSHLRLGMVPSSSACSYTSSVAFSHEPFETFLISFVSSFGYLFQMSIPSCSCLSSSRWYSFHRGRDPHSTFRLCFFVWRGCRTFLHSQPQQDTSSRSPQTRYMPVQCPRCPIYGSKKGSRFEDEITKLIPIFWTSSSRVRRQGGWVGSQHMVCMVAMTRLLLIDPREYRGEKDPPAISSRWCFTVTVFKPISSCRS